MPDTGASVTPSRPEAAGAATPARALGGASAGRSAGTEPHEVCGTPTAATGGAQTVTVTVQDADANRTAGDRDTLTFQVTVLDNPTVAASPTAANPVPFLAPPVV